MPEAAVVEPVVDPVVEPVVDPVEPLKAVDPVEPKGYWPEDWRTKVAGEDEKRLKHINRYTDPSKVYEALVHAQEKIAEGSKPLELGENPTDDELKAYREAMGVPEKWEDYSTNLPEGLVFGEEDKPVIDGFLEHLHKANVPQSAATAALQWYGGFMEAEAEAQAAVDEEQKINNLVALKEEFGPETKANLNAVKTMLATVDESLPDLLFGARGEDGGLLGNNPVVLKALAQIARENNPAALLAPGDITTSMQSIDDEIKQINEDMRKPGGRNPQAHARLVELHAAKERLGA